MQRKVSVNLYNWHMPGSLTMCLMIADETRCPFDAGSWNFPCYFLPENEEQHDHVIDLLQFYALDFKDIGLCKSESQPSA